MTLRIGWELYELPYMFEHCSTTFRLKSRRPPSLQTAPSIRVKLGYVGLVLAGASVHLTGQPYGTNWSMMQVAHLRSTRPRQHEEDC